MPVRVKIYGLLSLTRRGYLTLQVCGLVVVGVALALGLLLQPPSSEDGEPLPPLAALVASLLRWLPVVTLLLFAAGCVETWLVLRKFARKEKEQPPSA